MRKLTAILLMTVLMAGILSGCASDPVAEELSKFINTDMAGVNAKYEELKAEMAKWESMENDSEFADNLQNAVLPNIDTSLEMLSAIELKTEEVKAIKEKYRKVLETYKEGFQAMLEATLAGDVDEVKAADAKVSEGLELLDEYNRALETLAKEKNMEVTY